MGTALGTKLDRKPFTVYIHGKAVIEHVLTRHQAGTLDVDHKDRIVDFMVSNGLKYVPDLSWGEVAKLPQFRGTTGFFLAQEYQTMVTNTQRTRHRDMSHKEISFDLGLVLDCQANKKYQCKRKTKIEREAAFIQFWTRLSSGE